MALSLALVLNILSSNTSLPVVNKHRILQHVSFVHNQLVIRFSYINTGFRALLEVTLPNSLVWCF